MTRESGAGGADAVTAHEISVAALSDTVAEPQAVRVDPSVVRELELFVSRMQPGEAASVTRPAPAWKGDTRVVVDVTLARGADGTWSVRVGGERTTDAAPDLASPVDARLDDLSTMAWATDRERMARWFNEAWLDFVGADLASELGWGWMRHVHPDDVQGLLESYEAAQLEVRGFEHAVRVHDASGRYRRLFVRAVPRLDRGVFSGFVGLCKVSDRDAPRPAGLVDLLAPDELADGTAADAIARLDALESALEISRPAETLEAALLRRIVAAWTEQHAALRARHDDIVLSVHEAVTNSIRHAYAGQPGRVNLACTLHDDDAVFRVRDWGHWRGPAPDRVHRGIALMYALADDVRIERRPHGTEVTLSFRVGAST